MPPARLRVRPGAEAFPVYPSKAERRTEVFEYIEVFFNRRRISRSAFLAPLRARRRSARVPDSVRRAASRTPEV
jgi:hypothetical protein